MQSNLLSPILHSRHETLCDDEYSLSLSPENKRDAFLVVVVVVDDDDDDDFVVFKGRFFFDTHTYIRCGRGRRPTELMSSSVCSRVL